MSCTSNRGDAARGRVKEPTPGEMEASIRGFVQFLRGGPYDTQPRLLPQRLSAFAQHHADVTAMHQIEAGPLPAMEHVERVLQELEELEWELEKNGQRADRLAPSQTIAQLTAQILDAFRPERRAHSHRQDAHALQAAREEAERLKREREDFLREVAGCRASVQQALRENQRLSQQVGELCEKLQQAETREESLRQQAETREESLRQQAETRQESLRQQAETREESLRQQAETREESLRQQLGKIDHDVRAWKEEVDRRIEVANSDRDALYSRLREVSVSVEGWKKDEERRQLEAREEERRRQLEAREEERQRERRAEVEAKAQQDTRRGREEAEERARKELKRELEDLRITVRQQQREKTGAEAELRRVRTALETSQTSLHELLSRTDKLEARAEPCHHSNGVVVHADRAIPTWRDAALGVADWALDSGLLLLQLGDPARVRELAKLDTMTSHDPLTLNDLMTSRDMLTSQNMPTSRSLPKAHDLSTMNASLAEDKALMKRNSLTSSDRFKSEEERARVRNRWLAANAVFFAASLAFPHSL